MRLSSGSWRSVALYYGITLAATWSWWVPSAIAGRGDHILGLLGPLAGAVVATLLLSGPSGVADLGRRIVRWRIGWWQGAAALAGPIVFAVAVAAVGAALTDQPLDVAAFGSIDAWPSAGFLGLWVMQILVVGFGEETGWRGFALDRLQHAYGLVRATLIVGVLHALWHAPLFFFSPNFVEMGPGIRVVFFTGIVLAAPVFTWLYNRTGRSILAVALLHAAFNMATATKAAEGAPQAAVTTVFMVLGLALYIRWMVSPEARNRAPPRLRRDRGPTG